MFRDKKKLLKYAARLCTLAVLSIIILKLSGRDVDNGIIPIFILAVAGNAISYVLYRQK